MQKFIILAVDQDNLTPLLHIVAANSEREAVAWFKRHWSYATSIVAYSWAEWAALFAEFEQAAVEQIDEKMQLL